MLNGGEGDRIVRVSVRDVTDFLARASLPALVVAIAAAALAFLIGQRTEPEYRSVAILLATRTAGVYGASSLLVPPQIDPAIYRTVLVEGPLLAEALERLNGAPPTEAEVREGRRRVRVRVEDSLISSLIRIEAQDALPERAADFANTLADALRTWDRDRVRQNFSASIEALERAISQLSVEIERLGGAGSPSADGLESIRAERIEALAATEAQFASGAVVGLLESLQRAEPSSVVANDRAVVNAAIAFVVAFLVVVLVFLLRLASFPYVRTIADVEAVTGTRVLARVATSKGRATEGTDASIGWLHVRLRPKLGDASGRSYLFTCARDPRDKASVAVHVAESLADAGYRVLLVDADLTDTGVTRLLGIGAGTAASLEGLLDGSRERGRAVTVTTRARRYYDAIPSFRRLTRALPLFDGGMRALLDGWREDYDVILVDAAPVLPRADAQLLAELVDGIVLIVAADRTRVEDARAAAAALADVAPQPILTVLADEDRGRRGRVDRKEATRVGALHQVELTDEDRRR